jgi:hypothetical protein
VVIASAGIEFEDSAGALAILSRIAAGLDVDGAKRIGSNANEELAVGGLGNVEPVEQSQGLIGFRSGQMWLSARVLLNTWDEVENIAVITGSRGRGY